MVLGKCKESPSRSSYQSANIFLIKSLRRFVNTTTSDVKAEQAKDAEAVVKELENLKKKENYLETTLKNSQEHMEAIFKRAG
jgi:predicted mannosyl-3-phosphoglycerate phosphatase (HAD superfamily)